jgi:hypothetical protein
MGEKKIYILTILKTGFLNAINNIITPYIRMLDFDWLIAVIFFTNSGLAL